MMNPMNRPMFNAPMPSAEGVGITSGLTDPMQQEQMVTEQGLGQVAGGVQDMFNKIDASETPEETINAIRGDNASMEERYNELAMYVGKEDAEQTPETVLTLVQPTLTILEVAQQAPEGGISDVPIQAPGTEEASMRIAMGEQPVNFKHGGFHPDSNMYGVPLNNNSVSANANDSSFTLNTNLPYISQTAPNFQSLSMQDALKFKDIIYSQYEPFLNSMTGGAGLNPEARIARLSPYMPKKRSSEEILQEYQEMFGESDVESAKTQGFLELMKMGANIAQSPENLLRAATVAAGESAPGFQKIASDLSEKERALKLASMQESKEIERLVQTTELGIASQALTDSANAQAEIEKTKLSIFQDALRNGITLDEKNKKIINDELAIMYNANNKYGVLGTETWGGVIEDSQGNDKIDLIAVRRFEDGTKYLKDGRWIPTPDGYIPYDKNAFEAKFPNAAIDKSTAKFVDLLIPITQEMIDAGEEMNPTGYKQVAGFSIGANVFVSPDGKADNLVPAPPGFLKGKMKEILSVPTQPDKVGRVFVTNKLTGTSFLSAIQNADGSYNTVSVGSFDNQAPVYSTNAAGEQVLVSGNPMVRVRETGRIPYSNLSATIIATNQRKIINIVSALNEATEVLPMIQEAVGPLNSVKSWTSNIIGPLAPEAWEKMVLYSKTDAGRAMMDRFSRKLVLALALSDRYAVGEQKIIYEKLAANPETFWQNPKLSTERFAEMMRTLQNELSLARATLNDEESFNYLERLPTGTFNDPILFSGAGHMNALSITAATAGGKEKLVGTYIYLTQKEAEQRNLTSGPEGIKLQITGINASGEFQYSR